MWTALSILLAAVSVHGSPAGAVVNASPSWSPDGRWIAYTSNRDGTFGIWKTDGVHVRRVVRDGHDPAWSPDGRWIAFTARAGGIAVVPAGGGRPRTITQPGCGYEPSWSPNSRRIAFVRPGGEGDGYAVMTISTDGSASEQVSGSSEFDASFAPAWSPGGRSIAYVYADLSGSTQLARVSANGAQLDSFPQTTGVASRPSWSPDGRFLIFADDKPTGPETTGAPQGYGSLYLVNSRTKAMRRLLRTRAHRPAWSPGGRRIAFAAPGSGRSVDIYVVDRDGSHRQRLTKG